jgi:hypothetical protein
MDDFLYRCAVVVAKLGYVSGTRAYETGEQSTAMLVWRTFFLSEEYRGTEAGKIVNEPYYGYFLNLNGSEPINFNKNVKGYHMTPEDYRNACEYLTKMMIWAKETIIDAPEDSLDDFQHNLQIVLQNRYITWGQKGYAAAIFPGYYRHIHEQEDGERKKRSGYIGTEGKRESFDLKLIRIHSYEGNYGITYIYSFTDGTNYVTWFSSKEQSMVLDHRYEITGTVKKHEVTPKGYRQTILTRCKVGKDVTKTTEPPPAEGSP